MKLGAEDYLGKPIDVEELGGSSCRGSLEKQRLPGGDAASCASASPTKYRFENLVGREPEMLAAFKTVRQVAPVVLLGAAARRERYRQGAVRAGPATRTVRARTSRSSRWLARRCPRRCSRASCSATRRARSPARSCARGRPLRDGRRRARCSSTRSATSRPTVQVKLLRFLEEHGVRAGGRQPDHQGRRAHRARPPTAT